MLVVVSDLTHRMMNNRNLQVSADIGVQPITEQERKSLRYIKDIDGVRTDKFSDFITNNWLFESLREEDRNSWIYVPNSAENHNPRGLNASESDSAVL
jgi:hypothetical protein